MTIFYVLIYIFIKFHFDINIDSQNHFLNIINYKTLKYFNIIDMYVKL